MCNKYGIKESEKRVITLRAMITLKAVIKAVITFKNCDYIKDYDDINLDFSVQK